MHVGSSHRLYQLAGWHIVRNTLFNLLNDQNSSQAIISTECDCDVTQTWVHTVTPLKGTSYYTNTNITYTFLQRKSTPLFLEQSHFYRDQSLSIGILGRADNCTLIKRNQIRITQKNVLKNLFIKYRKSNLLVAPIPLIVFFFVMFN